MYGEEDGDTEGEDGDEGDSDGVDGDGVDGIDGTGGVDEIDQEGGIINSIDEFFYLFWGLC